jgi:hypothetical protein
MGTTPDLPGAVPGIPVPDIVAATTFRVFHGFATPERERASAP